MISGFPRVFKQVRRTTPAAWPLPPRKAAVPGQETDRFPEIPAFARFRGNDGRGVIRQLPTARFATVPDAPARGRPTPPIGGRIRVSGPTRPACNADARAVASTHQ